MNNFPKWLAACLLSLALCACASFPGQSDKKTSQKDAPAPATAPAPAPPTATAVFGRPGLSSDDLLQYAKRYNESSADNQRQEYTQVMQALGHSPKDVMTRLKTAIIFSMPASRYRDPTHALALLNELQREKLADDITNLVAVLKGYMDEEQKLEDSNLKMALKVRVEQHRADDLQQKLDALKNIEKNMIERDHVQ
jgi:hypothetical protein